MGRIEAQQLELEATIAPPKSPVQRATRDDPPAASGSRLALSPDEAAAALGVSRDYLDQHVIDELRIVRRGRRILIALAELERWLDRAATMRVSIDRRPGKAART
jgi:excisionase family DNA binding protein